MMRSSMVLFRMAALTGLVLVASFGIADAKKKKAAAPVACEEVDAPQECETAQAAATEERVASANLDSESSAGPLVPPEPVPAQDTNNQIASTDAAGEVEEIDTSEWYIGTMPDEPYDIPLVDRSKMDQKFERQDVAYNGKEPVGSIVVDIDGRFLYFIESEGKAIRYGIGVGRLGFSWRGNSTVGRKGVWPHWTPTENMRKVLPDLPPGMEGGLDSPLGARAIYLYQGGQDTLFRIHGTNEPWSIGERVSSGCVRLLNEDVADLYERVKVGASVYVRNSKHGTGMKMPSDDISG